MASRKKKEPKAGTSKQTGRKRERDNDAESDVDSVSESDNESPPAVKKRKPEDQYSDIEVLEERHNSSQMPDFYCNSTMGKEGEAGIIEKVSLKNFMCHTMLDVNFGPHVNFLIGRNGSGKSAVLTAMVVGLGGKANVTNRGSSVKSFIKDGRQMAEVTVKLRNRGSESYKPDQYGKAIVVERKLKADGVSSYKLKSAEGRLISTKREELNHILDELNIQVDNPVAILNQETSRNFLFSKNAHDKYKFFLKATQLEQMKQDYSMADESKQTAIDILKQKQETMPQREKEVYEWQQKYKSIAAIDGLKEKVDLLKNEIAWAQVYEKERELEPVAKDIKTEEARTPKFSQKIEESLAKVKEAESKKNEIGQLIQRLSDDVKALEPARAQAKKDRDETKTRCKPIEIEAQKVNNALKFRKRDRDQIQERIEEIRNREQESYVDKRKVREARIEGLTTQRQDIEAKQKTTDQSIEQFRSAVTKAKEETYRLRTENNELCSQKDQIRKRLADLEASRKNKMRRFGHWMPELQQRIGKSWEEGRFHHMPKGPLGAYISLRDPRWSLAVEICTRGLLRAFCVHDHHDERELAKICKDVCPPGWCPTVITSQFIGQRHNVTPNKPRVKLPTVLDMIDTDDAVVANCLIDQRRVENILLISEVGEARRIMSSSNPPANVREAFTMNGDQLYCRPTYRYYSANKNDKVNFLTANVEDDIRSCQAEIARLQVQIREVQNQEQRLNRDVESNHRHLKSSETQLRKLADQIGKINFEINELKNIEDPAPVDITTLEEEVRLLVADIENFDEKKKEIEARLTEARKEFQLKNNRFKEVDEQIRAIVDQSEPYKEQLGHASNMVQTAVNHKKHYEGKLKEHEKKIVQLKKSHDQQKKKVDADIAKAEQICPRIKTRRTSQNIESEIKQILKRIETEEKCRGNKEEITRKYYETREAYKKISRDVKKLENFLKTLGEVMDERHHQYFKMRQMIAMRAKYFFIMLLQNRQYIGKITFDHSKEALSMLVQPTKLENESSKDLRALSGGERSFSTVCFILSLWDAMDSPFRCLDEFDVFMDMVNRRISVDMMLKVALEQQGRQFIFLTPQDMSHLKTTKNVKILMMHPPERGQTALPFEVVRANNANEEDDDETMTQL